MSKCNLFIQLLANNYQQVLQSGMFKKALVRSDNMC